MVNDQFGHQAGDNVLRRVADLFLEHIRTEDLCARYGGEEFALLLRGQDGRGAIDTAERLRSTLQERSFDDQGDGLRITASIGAATLDWDAPQSADALLAEADRRLYEAKESGRNRTVGPTLGE